MRKIALVFAAFLALAILFSGCRDPKEEFRTTGEEDMSSLPSLTEEKPLPPSEEILIPNTKKSPDISTALPSTTSTVPSVTTVTTAPPTTAPSVATAVTTTTSSSGSQLELPDHNWN